MTGERPEPAGLPPQRLRCMLLGHAAQPSWRIFEHTRSRFIGMLTGRAYKSSVLENSSPFANALAYSCIESNRVLTTAVARPGRVSPRQSCSSRALDATRTLTEREGIAHGCNIPAKFAHRTVSRGKKQERVEEKNLSRRDSLRCLSFENRRTARCR